MRQFFIVYGDEDGGHVDGPFPEVELLRRISPDMEDEGVNWYGRNKFLDYIYNFDTWPEDAMTIIEGKIILPNIKRVVREYEI